MIGERQVVARRTAGGCAALLLLLFVVSCGGRGEHGDDSLTAIVKAENAAVGKSIEGQGWRITLLDAPEQTKMIGGEVIGEAGGIGKFTPMFGQGGRDFPDDDLTAEGMYLMAPVEVANIANEPQLMTGSVLKVIDSEGQEHAAAGRVEHVVQVWITEVWMDDVHELVPVVFNEQEAREGPLIFDVAEGATGLMLAIEGTDDTIELGF